MADARLIKQGITTYAGIQEIEATYRQKNEQAGRLKYEVWRLRRGPNQYAYEVYEH